MMDKRPNTIIGILLSSFLIAVFVLFLVNEIFEDEIKAQIVNDNKSMVMDFIDKGENGRKLGNLEFSIANYKKALEIDPENGDALTGLGRTYMEMQKYDTALKYLYRAASKSDMLFPDYAYGFAGTIYEKQERYNRALKAYRKAAKFAYQPVDAYVNMAGVFNKIGMPDSTIYYADQAMVAQLNIENYYKSKLKTAFQFYQDQPDIRQKIKEKLDDDFDESDLERYDIESLEESLRFSMNSAAANHFMGKAFARKGDIQKAVEHLRIANLIAPKNEMIQKDLQNIMSLYQSTNTPK